MIEENAGETCHIPPTGRRYRDDRQGQGQDQGQDQRQRRRQTVKPKVGQGPPYVGTSISGGLLGGLQPTSQVTRWKFSRLRYIQN